MKKAVSEKNSKNNDLKGFKGEIIRHFDLKTKQIEQNFDAKFNEVGKRFDGVDEKFGEMKQYIDEKAEETNRHFDVVSEDLKNEIQIVVEQVAANTEKLTEHGQKFDKIENTLQEIKSDLGQKVDRKEFVVLENRVGVLETKSK